MSASSSGLRLQSVAGLVLPITLCLAADVLCVAANASMLTWVPPLFPPTTADHVHLHTIAADLLSQGVVGTLIATGILWWTWSSRIALNLRILGVGTSFTPTWVIAWWLVPVANLFMPYQVHLDLWRRTGPHDPRPRLVVLWWALCVGTLVWRGMAALAEPSLAAGMWSFGLLLDVVSATVAVAFVRRLTARHEATVATLSGSAGAVVP